MAPADSAAVTTAGTGATYDSAGVGTGKTVTASGLTLSGTAAGNYVLAATTASAAIGTITPAPLTVTATAAGKTYEGQAYAGGNGVSYAGLVNGETASVLGGSLSYNGTAQGAVNAGTYAITPTGLTAANYTLTFADGALSVAKAPLTVTANAASKTYDGQAYAGGNGVSYTGLVNGETASVLGGSLSYGGSAQGAVNAGTYAIAPVGLTSANYTLTFADGALSVTKAPLTVTANAAGKTYDGQAYAGGNGVSYTGLVNGETASVLGGSLSYGGSAQGAVNAGTYAIAPTGLTAANYAVTFADGALSVGAKTLTASLGGSASKVYDGTATAGFGSLGYSLSGVAPADSAAVTTAGTGATYDSAGVGTGKTVTASGLTLSGAAAGNYVLAATTASAAIGTITPAPLTVTATAAGKTYDGQAYAGGNGVSYAGLVNGETASVLGGSLSYGGSAQGAVNAGTYAIAPVGLTAANYAIAYAPGALSIAPRPITVTANAQSRVYGDANPALTYTTSPLGAGAALTGGLVTAATASSDIGAYAITQGSLTTAANPNYALTFAGADLTIGRRGVTVTADTKSRAYGDANPALTYTIGGRGLVNGDALAGTLGTGADATSGVGTYAITQGSLAANPNYALTYLGADLTVGQRAVTVTADAQKRVYGDANPALTYATTSLGAGAALTGGLVTAATASSDIGTYAITRGSLTAAANPNYALTFIGANLTVGQRAVTVTADAQNRSYGDANPALTYTTTSLGAGAAFTGGLVTAATASSDIGIYAITQGSLTTAANPNYALTFAGADLTIGRRGVTVTADAKSRAYGDANPALTYRLGGRGLVNGDALAGTLATGAETTSGVGTYAITQGSLAAGANYALTYLGADLTVGQRAVTVTADAQKRVYGDANPALTYTIGGRGLVNGDALAGTLATGARATSGIGTYAITRGSLAATPNYALTYLGADLTIGQRAVTVTADNQTRAVQTANPALTYRLGGRGLVNGDTLSGALRTQAAESSPPGSYAIAQGTLAASADYVLAFTPGVLTVTGTSADGLAVTPTFLASTIDRTFWLNQALPSEQTVNRVVEAEGGAGRGGPPGQNAASTTFGSLTDPRFDRVVACTGSGVASACLAAPPPAPRPQAAR